MWKRERRGGHVSPRAMQDGLTVRERTHGRFSVVLVSPGGSLEESWRAREKGEQPEAPSIVGHLSPRCKRARDGDAFVNANYERVVKR